MYNDLFSIGPVTIHSYGLFTAIGLLTCLWLACTRAKKLGLNPDIPYGILFCGVIFGYICSKLTFVLVEVDQFIEDPKMFLSQSGFVVIGGLAGGVLAAYVYCRFKKERFIDYFDLCAPSIAIAQGFGRIGCFLAGCCYGRETTSFIGVRFPVGSFAPHDANLIPTQLISAALNFVNMAFLLWLAKKTRKKGAIAATYMITYSIGRFLIEFLRDDDRGVIGFLSTSQFFSVLILIAGVIFLRWALVHTEKEEIAVVESSDNSSEESSEGKDEEV